MEKLVLVMVGVAFGRMLDLQCQGIAKQIGK